MSNSALTQSGIYGIGPGVGAGLWTLVEEWIPSVAAASYTFSGLNGDVDEKYFIASNVVKNGSTGQYFLRLNNDSGTNYPVQVMAIANTTSEFIRYTTWTGLDIGYTGDADYIFSITTLNAKRGTGHQSISNYQRSTTTGVMATGQFAQLWTNTTDNITSIVAAAPGGGNFGVGTCIRLYKLGPPPATEVFPVLAVIDTGAYDVNVSGAYYRPTTMTKTSDDKIAFNSSTGIFTAPSKGLYQITLYVDYGGLTATRCVYSIFHNGSLLGEILDHPVCSYINTSTSFIKALEAGDTIALYLSYGTSCVSSQQTFSRVK